VISSGALPPPALTIKQMSYQHFEKKRG